MLRFTLAGARHSQRLVSPFITPSPTNALQILFLANQTRLRPYSTDLVNCKVPSTFGVRGTVGSQHTRIHGITGKLSLVRAMSSPVVRRAVEARKQAPGAAGIAETGSMC